MKAARVVLVGVGVAGLLAGAVFLVTTVRPTSIAGLVLWLAAAVVLHDGVLSPAAFVADLLLRRVGRRLPAAVVAVVQVAVVVGVVLTLIVLPEIRAKQLGPRNASVLPFDYGVRLGVTWLVLALLAALVCSVLVLRSRRMRGNGE